MRCKRLKPYPLEPGASWQSRPVRVPVFGWAAFAVSSDVDGELFAEYSTDNGRHWTACHGSGHCPGWDAASARIDDPFGMGPLFRVRFVNGAKPQDLLEVTLTLSFGEEAWRKAS